MALPFTSNNPQTPTQPNAAALSVTIAPVLPDGAPAKGYVDPDPGDDISIFTDYQAVNRFERDYHRYMMPIASPQGFQGKSAAFVQLAAETVLWISDWTAARFHKQPLIPDPDTGSADFELLDVQLETSMLMIGPDGDTPLYRISGVYVYGKRQSGASPLDGVSYPRPPWLQDIFDRSQPSVTLVKGLITPGSVGTVSTSLGGTGSLGSLGGTLRVN